MPEGPEIVWIKEQAADFIGQRLLHAGGQLPHIPYAALKGLQLQAIHTYGKELFFDFGGCAIRVHLLLFGKYIFNSTLNRQLRLGLAFENGTLNFYETDCRMVDPLLFSQHPWHRDVLHPAFDPLQAAGQLTLLPGLLVCDALLDQNLFAGVGNGIKNEVLFRSGLHPLSRVGHLPLNLLQRLAAECVAQSQEYLRHLQEDTLGNHWQVYRRNECPRDGLPLRKEALGKGKRSCYYCEQCQVLFAGEEGW